MKNLWKKYGTIIVVGLTVLFGVGTGVSYMASRGNTPEDRQMHNAGEQAPVTEVLGIIKQHPADVISVHRHIAGGAAFAERIVVEARGKSIWSITTMKDDEEFSKAIDETNAQLKAEGKAPISVKNERLQGEDGAVDTRPVAHDAGWGPTLVGIGVPLLITFFIWRAFSKSGAGGFGSGPFGAKKSPAKILSESPGEPVTLDDIEGIDEIKEELRDWIADIKDRGNIARLGGSPDKAKLFVGPPGTGKTMAARAIANECGLPFLYMSGGDFVRIFVGKGSENVDLAFTEARAARDASPHKAVFFCIDEVEALARKRGQMQGNDEAERTLNSMLSQMDGLNDVEGIFFIGMTNQPEAMDPAARRPGRFYPPIEFPTPDQHGRHEILKIYAKKAVLAPDVDLEKISRELPQGTTGATIKELMRSQGPKMARAMGRRRGVETTAVTQEALMQVAEEVAFGGKISEARSKRLPESFKDVVRQHETGHLITALVLHELSEPPQIWGHEVKVISGMGPGGTGGFVKTGIGENLGLLCETELRAHMVLGYGGTTAEMLFRGVRTIGNSNDIMQVNRAADEMVTKFHMSPDPAVPGVFVPRRSGPQYLGGEEVGQYDGLSDLSMKQIDRAKAILLRDAEAKAREILRFYEPFFHHFHPLLKDRPGYRMYTKEIYEIWKKETAGIAKPEWLSNRQIWNAYWDVRADRAPTLADLDELKAGAKRQFRALTATSISG